MQTLIPESMSAPVSVPQTPNEKHGMTHANQTFEQLAEPFRRELRLHCYRMLGSLHEAEDLVQETYLRAWRNFASFEGRAPLRAWLYRIATHACLDAIASRKHGPRLLPDQRVPATDQMPDGKPPAEVSWIEPYPDVYLEGIADDAPSPEVRYSSREAVQLAFVAVIQQLPPRQRATLLLCDVLGWSTLEAATLLGGSTASVNSARQRARETLARRYPDGRPPVAATSNPGQQALLARYVRTWEERDLDGFVALLTEEAVYTMPPQLQWYAGKDSIHRFFAWAWKHYFDFRLVPAAANRQPAFALYSRRSADAAWDAHSLHLLTLEQDAISSLTLFVKPAAPDLFKAFGLPLALTDTDRTA
ncbi:sigma-70 family RNA polymerase sigma factor [Dyella silvae]|uniref:sigma-70 family RNA polymerase sigma factor n=1 Tax=Dyella silvae TaxID=2994424 RepID=UPI002264763B|nr:sigma-70 family RNA polymerase sigma factor [Dyella silvae]